MQAITARPIFRARPVDQAHAATIAKALEASGAKVTPTTIMRHALRVAAGATVETQETPHADK